MRDEPLYLRDVTCLSKPSFHILTGRTSKLDPGKICARGLSCVSDCMRSRSRDHVSLESPREVVGGAAHTEPGVASGPDT